LAVALFFFPANKYYRRSQEQTAPSLPLAFFLVFPSDGLYAKFIHFFQCGSSAALFVFAGTEQGDDLEQNIAFA
jgi:hypothetical protein